MRYAFFPWVCVCVRLFVNRTSEISIHVLAYVNIECLPIDMMMIQYQNWSSAWMEQKMHIKYND